MNDIEKDLVNTNDLQEEAPIESMQEAASSEETQAPVVEETPQAKNFRALREKAARIERERDEAMRRLQELESAKNPEEDYSVNLGDDDLAEGKHLSKMQKQIKKLEAKLKQTELQSTATLAEAKLKMQYPDFDAIVSKDNVETLRLMYPELAHTLNSSTDIYSTAVSAYTMIKKLGIHQEDAYAADRERAQRNAVKPRPLASVNPQQGDSPLSHANAFANGLTDELKAQLLKEMMDARR